MDSKTTPDAAILLGGAANALSIARSLGRSGVPIVVSNVVGSPVLRSRFCHERFPYRDRRSAAEAWRNFLIGEAARLEGAVILPCDDEAVEFVARNRDLLVRSYRIDDSIPELQLDLLDKRRTLELASSVGVPVPGFYQVDESDDIAAVSRSLDFPVILKPLYSHLFQRAFGRNGRKFFLANHHEELEHYLMRCVAHGIDVMVTEKIPGPDTLLGSYYTYIDAHGRSLFHYTKKIIRRYPKNEGLACCHVSTRDEEIAVMGRRFFEGIGFRGFGNVEFKRDPRDGKLKIIECNARFTDAQELLLRTGADVARLVYDHLVTGETVLEQPAVSHGRGVQYWYPLRDFRAFLELRGLGEISAGKWLRSIAFRRHVFPYFQWTDPLPAISRLCADLRKIVPYGDPALNRRSHQESTY